MRHLPRGEDKAIARMVLLWRANFFFFAWSSIRYAMSDEGEHGKTRPRQLAA